MRRRGSAVSRLSPSPRNGAEPRPGPPGLGPVGQPATGMTVGPSRRIGGAHHRKRHRTWLPLLGLLLPGCDLGPDYRRPATELPPAWRATEATAAAAWPNPVWWRGFASPTLDRLIEQARAQNFDIA